MGEPPGLGSFHHMSKGLGQPERAKQCWDWRVTGGTDALLVGQRSPVCSGWTGFPVNSETQDSENIRLTAV